MVKVFNGKYFEVDPCRLLHVCIPWKSAQDEVTRVVYEKCRQVSSTPAYAEKTPKQVWQEPNEYVDFHSDEDPQRREEMLFHFHKGGYEARRNAVSRALRKLHDHRVSMTEVPEEYPCLPDGTRFLQYHTPELLIYYFAWVIEKACALRLKAIVADGVHGLQPDATNKIGQLYVIHGVTGNGVDTPLLDAITIRDYERIFGTLKRAMTTGPLRGLLLVLDFERAAVKAARKVFPSTSVEDALST
nr:unnamed protein product [Haemonchus contortus]